MLKKLLRREPVHTIRKPERLKGVKCSDPMNPVYQLGDCIQSSHIA